MWVVRVKGKWRQNVVVHNKQSVDKSQSKINENFQSPSVYEPISAFVRAGYWLLLALSLLSAWRHATPTD